MAAGVLRQRGHAEVGAVGERALHERSEEGVVDADQRPAALAAADVVGDGGEQRGVGDGGGRVRRRLRPDEADGPGGDRLIGGRLDRLAIGAVGEAEGADAEARQFLVHEGIGAAVDRPTMHERVAGRQLRQQHGGDRRHAGGEGGRCFGAVEGGEARLDHVEIGVAEAAVDVAAGTVVDAVEEGDVQVLRRLRGWIDEGRRQVGRGLGRAVGGGRVVAVADRQRLAAHGVVAAAHRARPLFKPDGPRPTRPLTRPRRRAGWGRRRGCGRGSHTSR